MDASLGAEFLPAQQFVGTDLQGIGELYQGIGIRHGLTGFSAARHAQGDAREFGQAALGQFGLAAQAAQAFSEGSHFDGGEVAEVAIHGRPGRS
jgi:hypothetical protein